MSNVSLSIGGRAYTVACDPGEEGHLAALGRMIDAKLATLPGGQNETRALLFAALLLAEDLHEAKAAAAPAGQLAGIAERLETLAGVLERGV